MAIREILSSDKLSTGFRAKYNETIKEIIVSIADQGDGTVKLVKFDNSYITLDMRSSFFTKPQITNILSAINPATTENLGTVKLATPTQVIAGTDTSVVVTPEAFTIAFNEKTYFLGDWTNEIFYKNKAVVVHNGQLWQSQTNGVISEPSTSDADWKSIGGVIDDQLTSIKSTWSSQKISSELQSKEPTIPTGTPEQYLAGDKTWKNFANSVKATLLSGYTKVQIRSIAVTDTLLTALGILESKVDSKITKFEADGFYQPKGEYLTEEKDTLQTVYNRNNTLQLDNKWLDITGGGNGIYLRRTDVPYVMAIGVATNGVFYGYREFNPDGSTKKETRFTVGDGNAILDGSFKTKELILSRGDGTSETIFRTNANGIDIKSAGNIAPHYQTNFSWYTGNIGEGNLQMLLDNVGNLTLSGRFIKVNGIAIGDVGNVPRIQISNGDISVLNSSNSYGNLGVADATKPNHAVTLNQLNDRSYSPVKDLRILAPNSVGAKTFQNFFLTFNNNAQLPFADGILMNGYGDETGGKANLVVFNKSTFGLRQYQGNYNSSTPFTDYVDYWNTSNLARPATYGVGSPSFVFNWSGRNGQPTWLIGGESSSNLGVYDPISFNVNSANTLRVRMLGNASANTAKETGIYRNENGLDATYAYSPILSLQSSDTGAQICVQFGGAGLAYRGMGNGGSNSPTPWHIVADKTRGNTFTGDQIINGNLQVNGTATFRDGGFNSDARLKDIVDQGLPKLEPLPLKSFTWKADKSEQIHYGHIAQDVEKVAPELVYEDEEGNKSVRYIELLLLEINHLKNRVNELERRLS